MLSEEIKTGVAPKEYWDKGYENFVLKREQARDVIYRFIREFAGKAKGRTESVLEIGSFPGTYVSEFGELGYVINGIDIQPRNATDLPKWLKDQNYEVGDFVVDDIFKFQCKRKFNVVCSFGFIEHFENFLDVIDIHAQLVEKGGKLIITTPNFRGAIQKFMHKYLSPNDYSMHYIPWY